MESHTPTTGGNKLALSAQQYTKIIGTIASVRRIRKYRDNTDMDANQARPSSTNNKDPSFIAETSFTRAPLNSRVASISAVHNGKGKTKQENLDRIPVDIQEALILEDLLYVLMGIEGTYITYGPDYSPGNDEPLRGIRFIVSPLLDSSLRDLVGRVLPLSTYYTAITSFIERRSHFDYGLVNHALCAAIRDMLKDYRTLLSQLEHAFNFSPQFTLTKLWFYVHPTVRTLSLIYNLILELETAAESPSERPSESDSSSTSDAEANARDEALGLGGAKFKALLSMIDKDGLDTGAQSGIAVKGGEVLTIIYERMQHMSGDPTARALYDTLFRAAGAPYVAMIKAWTTTGRLMDPYDEFCVKESKLINRGTLQMDYIDEYWEERYTLRDGSTTSASSKGHQSGVPRPRPGSGRFPGGACIPPLLEGWKHKILLAGKFLNVVRECGIEMSQNQSYIDQEDLSMDDEQFYKSIENAYTHANRTLLQLLLKDQQLIPRLRTLKRYFLLSQSTFLRHFLDLSHNELRKSPQSASLIKLQSLLDLAVNAESGDADDMVFREDLKVTIAGSGLYEWLLKVTNVSGLIGAEANGPPEATGQKGKEKEKDDKKPTLAIDALVLDYTVTFPLSLVISRKAILRYQLLFRFLLHLKHVEQSLSSMWIEHKTAPWRQAVPNHPELEKWRLRICLLRMRMLAFVQQILAFATFEVLEPNWRALETKLANVTTVDQLLMNHVDFLDTCLKGCMLTSSKLLEAYSRLIVTCTTFALYTSAFSKHATKALAAAATPTGDQDMAERWVFLAKFETHFNHWFKLHLNYVQRDASSENVSLLPLVVRLRSIQVERCILDVVFPPSQVS